MDERWAPKEIEAAVIAYMQMLHLEKKGVSFNKAAISRALLAGPLKGRTSTDHRMQNISAVLQEMGREWIGGFKPLQNVGPSAKAEIQSAIAALDAPDAIPVPLHPPVLAKETRKLPPTGYWIFVCNRGRWDGEAWLNLGQTETLYKVSEHNRDEVQVGDLGVLRLNKRSHSTGSAGDVAGVYAIVEVVESPSFRSDSNVQGYVDPTDGSNPAWRAKVRLLANLVDAPIDAESFSDGDEFQYLKSALQTSTIPLSRVAFEAIVSRSGVDKLDLTVERRAATVDGIRRLEAMSRSMTPNKKERVSSYIERGPVGDLVKRKRGYRCQICETLKQPNIAFLKPDGKPYCEAHHVQPVSLMLPGSLAASNIMVLCPNHHRQAHYGHFEIVKFHGNGWEIKLDNQLVQIQQTMLDEG